MNRLSYVGSFENDVISGFGTMTWTNGKRMLEILKMVSKMAMEPITMLMAPTLKEHREHDGSLQLDSEKSYKWSLKPRIKI